MFFDLPSTAEWIIRPEMSKAFGYWGPGFRIWKTGSNSTPYLYLAYTSGIKIGVTRKSQVPTRWIDQGAVKAVEIIEVPNRYLAGISNSS